MSARNVDVSMNQLTPLITELLGSGTDVEFTPTGNSMKPLWHHRRDIVKLTAVKAEEIRKWDVLLYKRADGSYILHRVVAVGEDTLDFLGDAQFGVEKEVPKTSVVAKVKGYKRKGKKYKSAEAVSHKLYIIFWCKTRGVRYFFFRAFKRIKKLFGAV